MALISPAIAVLAAALAAAPLQAPPLRQAKPLAPPTRAALGEMRDRLARQWSPDCAGKAAYLRLQIRLDLNPDGSLTAAPEILDQFNGPNPMSDPAVQASTARALAVLTAAAPYSKLPRDDYESWKQVIMVFDANHACGEE